RLSRYMRRWLVERFFAWIRGSAGSSFVGSTTPTISSALSNLPASLSSSNDFEIGSSQKISRIVSVFLGSRFFPIRLLSFSRHHRIVLEDPGRPYTKNRIHLDCQLVS